MENSGRIIAAFLAGAAAGASLGLLLAPEKGEATRKRIVDTFDDLGDKAAEQYAKYKRVVAKEEEEKSKG